MRMYKKNLLPLRIVKLLNVLLIAIPFVLGWYFKYISIGMLPIDDIKNPIILFLFACFYVSIGKVYDAFLVSLNRISEMIYSQTLAFLISDAIMYLISIAFFGSIQSILPYIAIVIGQFLMSILWCVASHKWYFKVYPPKRTAIIYQDRKDMESLIGEYGLEKKFSVELSIPAEECLADIDVLKGNDIETVFISGVSSEDRNGILKYCIQNDIAVLAIPRIGDIIMSGARKRHMFHLPMLSIKSYCPSLTYLVIKRLFDIFVSLVALVILSPVFIVTAIAVKSDGGPAFYKQERLTKGGKKFFIHKFRSMRVDAEKDGVARLSSGENDDRITPVGKVIRKLRIDELPQLIDILQGNLSIVGPRPEREEIALQYEEVIPEFRLRLQAKAGLTGYAQVYGKYNTTPYDKLQMDLMYIANPSLIEDFKICLATVKILFMPESTEGVDENQTTAIANEEKENELVK